MRVTLKLRFLVLLLFHVIHFYFESSPQQVVQQLFETHTHTFLSNKKRTRTEKKLSIYYQVALMFRLLKYHLKIQNRINIVKIWIIVLLYKERQHISITEWCTSGEKKRKNEAFAPNNNIKMILLSRAGCHCLMQYIQHVSTLHEVQYIQELFHLLLLHTVAVVDIEKLQHDVWTLNKERNSHDISPNWPKISLSMRQHFPHSIRRFFRFSQRRFFS